MARLLAAMLAVAPSASSALAQNQTQGENQDRVCDAAHIGEPEIRVAALLLLAEKGAGAPVPMSELVETLDQRLVTCEGARERQLLENRIRVMAYRSETRTGLKDRGQAVYDPEAHAWAITEKGYEEIRLWCGALRARCPWLE